MKYILIILLLFIFHGCNYYQGYYDINNFKINKDLDDIKSILSFCYNDINYEAKTIINKQNPDETLSLKKGNCIDKSILFVAICNNKLNKKMNLIFTSDHAFVEYNNKYYDPTKNYYEFKNKEKINHVIKYSDINDYINDKNGYKYKY